MLKANTLVFRSVTEAVETALISGDSENLLTLVTNLPADQVFQRQKFSHAALIRMIPMLVPYVSQHRSIADWVQECILGLNLEDLNIEIIPTYKVVLEHALETTRKDQSPRGGFLCEIIENAIVRATQRLSMRR